MDHVVVGIMAGQDYSPCNALLNYGRIETAPVSPY